MASMGVSLPLALGYAMENQRVGDPAKKVRYFRVFGLW